MPENAPRSPRRLVARVALFAAVCVAGCVGNGARETPREETAGDGLWALAEDFHAKGNEDAYRATLRFLLTRYPSSRRAAKARVVLGEDAPASSVVPLVAVASAPN